VHPRGRGGAGREAGWICSKLEALSGAIHPLLPSSARSQSATSRRATVELSMIGIGKNEWGLVIEVR
jgi:hypothetical protein